MNPLEDQSSPPRPPGAAQGNPLARLAAPLTSCGVATSKTTMWLSHF